MKKGQSKKRGIKDKNEQKQNKKLTHVKRRQSNIMNSQNGEKITNKNRLTTHKTIHNMHTYIIIQKTFNNIIIMFNFAYPHH